MRKIAIIISAALPTGAAHAQPASATPEDCPVPADAPAYAGEDVDAGDLNPWRQAADDEDPYLYVDVAEHPQVERIILRLRADGKTGEVLAAPPEAPCEP